ncbi:conjugal transfer protein TraC [Candidatus Falkowbacteria bacterium RIFOXYD2_FULL_35_9]|uniref:Conjugal transfer protein TraC n=1 Tax=Candidatus Falkowbacteria bacterium RIFOXYC2_FULL_36_12 TaxID=1798002 RepID=A0A1F5SWB8_9BACT|nr:MAG: conjugal transfer protein TraC [Candidatus Falkowbacteria bacterium RIFOXYB2_FULL_35_7]OGF31024.1 MAG: conjugal transfer protein TraC [Candidatus Falkowbacteria bacterium RIFOXYC2_FULL_36_12]OGF45983.1 MAG: conjugal transfer protein TraC [Candidatus Falkowbacteria bacterium RIFOXYD2_FULL_35_9]
MEEEKQIEQETAQSTQIIEQEKVYRQGVVSVLDLIAPAAFDIKPSFVKIGGLYARTLFVMAYPRYISVGWFAPIINYNSSLDIGMFFYPMESELVLKQLKNKVGVLQAQLSSDAEDGKPRDPLRQTALQDIEQLRDDLTQGVEKFFQFALYTTLYAKTEEDLDKLTEDVESVFGSRMVYTKRVFYQAEQGFNSTVPIGNDELMITANLNSSPIASSFPFISSDLTSDNGILYGINRHNNSLIIFDRFSLQNANCTVFATSGAGKSYTIKLEVLRSMMMGTDVIIIDPEKEYKLLSDAVGGTFVNISLNSESKINPFDLPRAVGDSTSVEDIIRSAVINIKGLLKLMIGEWTFQEDTVIDRALIETYAKKDITPESDLAKIEPPLMEDLYQVLDGMEGGADIALRLKKFTSGTFSGLFNAPTNVDMSNQLVIYSVRDLEDELRAMAIYNIVNYVWNVVRSELKKRILVVDEAWWLMMNDDSARFLHGLVKRGRKYYLGVTTITQDVNDFLGSKYGPGIVNNSALKILMRQSVSSVDIVSKTFDLTKGEKYLLLESNVGEGIFFAGDKHVAIKVVASGLEDSIITSDPKQLLEMEKQKKKQAEEASEA